MFLCTKKSCCWRWPAIPSMSLSNASKYKIDTNLSKTGGNVLKLNHKIVLLIEVLGEVQVYQHLSKSIILTSNLFQNPTEASQSHRECAAVQTFSSNVA